MYFPYLRGKRFELKALRELSNMIVDNGRILPIIEPVKRNVRDLQYATRLYREDDMPFVIVVNPRIGQLINHFEIIKDEIIDSVLDNYNNYYIGYIISSNTTLQDIRSFISEYRNYRVCFIHYYSFSDGNRLKSLMDRYNNIAYNIFLDGYTSRSYWNIFNQCDNIIIRDGFRVRKNSEYPPDEFFSDLHTSYPNNGFKGFGDFLTIGDYYYDQGGPAYAVAIHLSYLRNQNDIWVRHFVSDRTTTPVDQEGKFLEALDKLVNFLNEDDSGLLSSLACQEFIQLYNDQHSPGLGFIKKLSIRHHIELFNSII